MNQHFKLLYESHLLHPVISSKSISNHTSFLVITTDFVPKSQFLLLPHSWHQVIQDASWGAPVALSILVHHFQLLRTDCLVTISTTIRGSIFSVNLADIVSRGFQNVCCRQVVPLGHITVLLST